MKRKATRYIVTVVALLLIALIFYSCGEYGRNKNYENRICSTEGPDSLSVYITFKGGIYGKRGDVAGFEYSLLKRFTDAYDADMNIVGRSRHNSLCELLSDDGIDIIVMNSNDSIPCDYAGKALSSVSLNGIKWVVRKHDLNLLCKINTWLMTFSRTREYRSLKNKFLRSYKLDEYFETMTQTDRISPYDDIIKQESEVLGWDWRLLAAVISKESRFSINAYSGRGAVGLMQVLPSTAKIYGIKDLFDPASNIKAGINHLVAIKDRYEDLDLDSTNLIKFTLAAYNAGEGRIEDCINFTMHQGEDYRNWESISRTIPLMEHSEYIKNAKYLKFKPFSGGETIKYVDNVISQYEDYQYVVMR